jgi:cell division protein ZapA (FtsZ GTPase activity inhibitor)
LSNRVELTLLGQTLSVRTEAAPDYIRSLAKFLEKRVESLRKAGVQDSTKALMLAALDITDELFRAREEHGQQDDEMGARLGALVALLEKATPKDARES